MELTLDIARKFAQVALGHVTQEYPNKLDHVLSGDEDLLRPSTLHPVFYGSYDWHSCVHSWWTLLTLRRLYPDMAEAQAITDLAYATFTTEKLAVELAYLDRAGAQGFERPYGWGWLLALHQEAKRHTDRQWGIMLTPLANAFAERFETYLGKLTYPITVGTHFNTAFALILAYQWSRNESNKLLIVIEKFAVDAFANKTPYNGWEPGGDEFLSPVLTASLLMSHVMRKEDFNVWFDRLVLRNGWIEEHCHPVTVSDRTDGKIAHLDGLNLSRAWCLRGIDSAIGPNASSAMLQERAKAHLEVAIPHVAGDYMGEHWLASFALLALLVAE